MQGRPPSPWGVIPRTADTPVAVLVRRKAGITPLLPEKPSASSGGSGCRISLYFALLPCFFPVRVWVPPLYLFFSFLFFSSLVLARDLVFLCLHIANWWGSALFFTLFPFPSCLIYTSYNLCAKQERRRFCFLLPWLIYFTRTVYRAVQYDMILLDPCLFFLFSFSITLRKKKEIP